MPILTAESTGSSICASASCANGGADWARAALAPRIKNAATRTRLNIENAVKGMRTGGVGAGPGTWPGMRSMLAWHSPSNGNSLHQELVTSPSIDVAARR